MTTATLTGKSKVENGYRFVVLVTDGVSKVERILTTSTDDDSVLQQFARNEAARMGVVAVSKGTIAVGDQIDLTPPVPVDSTPGQQARAAFVANRRALKSLQQAAAEGFIDPGDKRITDLQAVLKASWLDSYVDMLE